MSFLGYFRAYRNEKIKIYIIDNSVVHKISYFQMYVFYPNYMLQIDLLSLPSIHQIENVLLNVIYF